MNEKRKMITQTLLDNRYSEYVNKFKNSNYSLKVRLKSSKILNGKIHFLLVEITDLKLSKTKSINDKKFKIYIFNLYFSSKSGKIIQIQSEQKLFKKIDNQLEKILNIIKNEKTDILKRRVFDRLRYFVYATFYKEIQKYYNFIEYAAYISIALFVLVWIFGLIVIINLDRRHTFMLW